MSWKGREESLFIFRDRDFTGKKVLIVDDLIETGNSLEASVEGLNSLGLETAGAFYLCDASEDNLSGKFSFPIKSFLRINGILGKN